MTDSPPLEPFLRELARELTDEPRHDLDSRINDFLASHSDADPAELAHRFTEWIRGGPLQEDYAGSGVSDPTPLVSGEIDEDCITRQLYENFRLDSFRPGQLETITNVLRGYHTLLVMPTGGGKSLCYQLPAVITDGVTLVISPLISLMKDQVDDLREQGIRATAINSSFSASEQIDRLQGMEEGKYDMVYVAPERLESQKFQRQLEGIEVNLLAVDEAHCISKWGYDFRPSYRQIPEARKMVGSPVVLATTATATPRVQKDIRKQLELSSMDVQVRGFNRPNLHLEVDHVDGAFEKRQRLEALLGDFGEEDGSVIVYVGTRDETEEVSDFIRNEIGCSAHPYHGGMERQKRKDFQRDFLNDEVTVMVATNAFGMGIDKPDIRKVIHYRVPGNVESYYQEAGRAGRDGDPAQCLLLYDPSDKGLQKFFIQNDAPDRDELYQLYDAVRKSPPGSKNQPLPPGRTARVNKWDVATETGIHEVKIQVGIRLLEEAGWIEDLGMKKDVRHLKVGKEDYDRMEEQVELVEQRRREKFQRLKKMVAYTKDDVDCRRSYILQYFGDGEAPAADRCCDRCDADGDGQGSDEERSPTDELIVDAIQTLSFNIGVHKLAMILTGSQAQSITENGYDDLPFYGKLSDWSQREARERIKSMIQKNMLRKEGNRRPVLEVVGPAKGDRPREDPFEKEKESTEEPEKYPPF